MPGNFDVCTEHHRHSWIDIPARSGVVVIGEDLGHPHYTQTERCELPLEIWKQVRVPIEKYLRGRLRMQNLPMDAARFATGRNMLSHHLGQHVLVLAWAVEHDGDIETALERWSRLAAFETPWLYKQVVEQGFGLADSPNRGWRRALKAALQDEKHDPLATAA